MLRTAKHYYAQGSASQAQPNFSITPKLSNLTLGPVPNDLSEIVVSTPSQAGITDKLNSLLDEYRTELVAVPSSGGCVDDVTARGPRGLVFSLNEILRQGGRACLRETNLMIALLENLLAKNTNSVNLTRNFWLQMHRVFEELNANEATLNTFVAAVRAVAFPISSDVQSLPTTNMILAAKDVFDSHQDDADGFIDNTFRGKYPNLIKPSPPFEDAISRVISDMPTSLGLDSAKPATQIVGVGVSDGASKRQLFDLDGNDIHGSAYRGLKNMFSSMQLCTPIKDLNLLTYDDGKPQISYYDWVTITSGDTPPQKVTVLTAMYIDASGLDVHKSILEQDWAVRGTKAANYQRATDADKWINIFNVDAVAKAPTLVGDAEDTARDYIGISGRAYTHTEVTGLSDALGGLWRKITSLHFPSPATLDAGLGILAAGLGAVGSFSGCAGLVKASDIVSGVKDGLGYFIPSFKNAMGVAPDPKAGIIKNALTVVPALIEAGKSTYEAMGTSSLDQRVTLGSWRSLIEHNFGRVSDQDKTSRKLASTLHV